uniref:Uncharacterized protein n=1 Tax=Anguilla anguilla TaxID=7936 RepID=A0A0E9T9J0_ANGAN
MHTHAYTLLLCLGSAYTETLSHLVHSRP